MYGTTVGDYSKWVFEECPPAVYPLWAIPLETLTVGSPLHRIQPAAAVPTAITQMIGYDVEKSLKLLRENWTPGQMQLLNLFEEKTKKGMVAASHWPEYMFMNEDAWMKAYHVFLDNFMPNDEDWREVLFKMWVARVLNYTMRHVLRGNACALQANSDMVQKVQRERSLQVYGEWV